MIITCVNCNVRYNIDDSRFNAPQKKVKCSKCGEVFIVKTHNNTSESSRPEVVEAEIKTESDMPDSISTDQPSLEIDREEKDYSSQKEQAVESEITDKSTANFASANGSSPSEVNTDDLFSTPKNLQSEVGIEREVSFEEESSNPFDTPVIVDEENKKETLQAKSETTSGEVQPESNDETEEDGSEDETETETMELIDWENLEVDVLQNRVDDETQQMATISSVQRSDDELNLEESKTHEKEGFKKKSEPEKKERSPFSSALAPDFSDDISMYNRASAGKQADGENTGGPVSQNPFIPSARKKQGFISKFFMNFLYIIVFIIVITTALFALVTFDVVPEAQFDRYVNLVSGYLPESFKKRDEKQFENLYVTNTAGKWIATRNGYMYVVYGEVVNKEKKPVNHIKLKSTFNSAGSKLYEQEFYAGNTFTTRELKNQPASRLKQKLNRKEGDVDLQDVSTFAGRNYNIESGESVPFYTFYLSGNKILGLKYNVEVTAADSGEN